MAEGTRLKEMSEQIKALEEKMQTIPTECHTIIDGRLQQFGIDYNQRLEALVHQLEEIQLVDQQRYEAQQLEATRRHEQLIKMFGSQNNAPKNETKPALHNPSVQFREGRAGGEKFQGVVLGFHIEM